MYCSSEDKCGYVGSMNPCQGIVFILEALGLRVVGNELWVVGIEFGVVCIVFTLQ
jgi:hypothetical protein